MIKWIKDFLRHPYDQAAKEVSDVPQRDFLTPEDVPSNISEPVLSIVKTFGEKGRWRITSDWDLELRPEEGCDRFKVLDKVTQEEYILTSYRFNSCLIFGKLIHLPSGIVGPGTLPTWLTKDEKAFVVEIIELHLKELNNRVMAIRDRYYSKDQKKTKAAQDKERQRLMNLYCGEAK